MTVTTAHVEEELGAGTHDTVLVKGTGDAVARLEYVDGVYLLTCTMRERGSRGERECRGSSAVPSTTHTNSLVLGVLCFRVCSHRELLPQLFRACKPGGKLMYQEAVGGSGQRSADQVWGKGDRLREAPVVLLAMLTHTCTVLLSWCFLCSGGAGADSCRLCGCQMLCNQWWRCRSTSSTGWQVRLHTLTCAACSYCHTHTCSLLHRLLHGRWGPLPSSPLQPKPSQQPPLTTMPSSMLATTMLPPPAPSPPQQPDSLVSFLWSCCFCQGLEATRFLQWRSCELGPR